MRGTEQGGGECGGTWLQVGSEGLGCSMIGSGVLDLCPNIEVLGHLYVLSHLLASQYLPGMQGRAGEREFGREVGLSWPKVAKESDLFCTWLMQ